MKIFLVIEDIAFYTPGEWPDYIPIDDLNGITHSIVHGAFVTKEQAEEALTAIAEGEAHEWGNVWPEEKSIQDCGSDSVIKGLYLLGSFYYIQEVELDKH